VLTALCDEYAGARSRLDAQIEAEFTQALDASKHGEIQRVQNLLAGSSDAEGAQLVVWPHPRLTAYRSFSTNPAKVTQNAAPYWTADGLVVARGTHIVSGETLRVRVRVWQFDCGSDLSRQQADPQVEVSAIHSGQPGINPLVSSKWSQNPLQHDSQEAVVLPSFAFARRTKWLTCTRGTSMVIEATDASRLDKAGKGCKLGVATEPPIRKGTRKRWIALTDIQGGDAGRVLLSVESEEHFFNKASPAALSYQLVDTTCSTYTYNRNRM